MKLKKSVFFTIFLFLILLIKGYFLYTNLSISDYEGEKIYQKGDPSHYYMIAKNIFEFNTYSDDFSNIPNESATWRPPIWPLVLSTFFYLSQNPFSILLIKIIFEFIFLTSILIYFKKKLKIKWFYLSPLLLLYIEPQYLKYSLTFFSESLSALLILFLSILFLNLKKEKRFSIYIPILSSIIILCHPVSAFFVASIMGVYCLINLQYNFKVSILHGLLFVLLSVLWPIRNQTLFNQGFYLTASQGATFSKGWNEKIISDFTNVEGDLAEEEMNLKYIKTEKKIIPNTIPVLERSKLYKEGTLNFINSISMTEKLKIILIKIKSNFNPFPEKPKPGFFENLSIVFRIFYLILFIQMFKRIFQFKKFNIENLSDKVFLVVLSIFIGQTLMSAYIYTGFRFNAIYSLTCLFCFILINKNWLFDKWLFKNKLNSISLF
ncbi:hypothetical protein [Flavobacterium capsici]|uniref:Uncharacterized protein n=1 Tax=Flavobacterium capsici TaxID=3075618 RepID=A0AA96J3A6_9FLAO|nr:MULTISPECIES: hypothetical protein [unclassified Flavobacterium]WNM20010.1 hypothetical protein RN608_04840 [Flavobacterium sp. PMR2A8]WNM21399.1 hypothetical protein RN605_12010 [Flavobacterium sp. PMTSA4]